MKKLLLALVAVVGLATPAVAADKPNSNFVGPKVELTAGLDNVKNYRDSKINYGAAAGFDLPVGNRLTVGVEANANNVFDYTDIGASARLGVAVTDNLLLYGKAGYAKLRDFSGPRVGAGLELHSGLPFYSKVEYRYSDFQDGVGRHEALVGFGLRF